MMVIIVVTSEALGHTILTAIFLTSYPIDSQSPVIFILSIHTLTRMHDSLVLEN